MKISSCNFLFIEIDFFIFQKNFNDSYFILLIFSNDNKWGYKSEPWNASESNL